MRTRQGLAPEWMPLPNTVACVAAGQWWDAVSVPQLEGLNALEILDRESGRAPGPVIWDPSPRMPRLYFLVGVGAAATWEFPETVPFGETTFLAVPAAATIEPPGIHWLVPPDPDEPGALVDAAALRDALLRTLGGDPC